MHFLSTEFPEYFTPEVPSGRPFGARVRERVLRPTAKLASYPLMGVGLTLAGWGVGFESAWVLGMLFAYPLSESVDWAATRVRAYGS